MLNEVLFGAEHAVTRIAKAGHDIAVFIEFFIHGRREDGHIRVGPVEALHAFGGRKQGA